MRILKANVQGHGKPSKNGMNSVLRTPAFATLGYKREPHCMRGADPASLEESLHFLVLLPTMFLPGKRITAVQMWK